MKEVRQAIEERIAEMAEAAVADLQILFTQKFPKKGYSEKWLERNLEKYGAKLVTSEGWLREILDFESGHSGIIDEEGDRASDIFLFLV